MPAKKACALTVAFQGEEGAFSHAAARKFLGDDVQILACLRFRDVFAALNEKSVTHAVIPIENTLYGSVLENYDNLVEYGVPIIGETSIRISHQLIVMPGTKLRHVNKVYSHPVALSQCLEFFRANPRMTIMPHYDTAGSVKMLKEERPEQAAAIASEAAARIYGGVILKRNIEDDRQNFTRFFLLSRAGVRERAGAAWKTTLVFGVANEPGALFKSMACFALRGVNLTKLESRPLRGRPWEYLFSLDLVGRSTDRNVAKAIDHLREMTSILTILGSYQATV
jgi:prephenate dehydratase